MSTEIVGRCHVINSAKRNFFKRKNGYTRLFTLSTSKQTSEHSPDLTSTEKKENVAIGSAFEQTVCEKYNT